MNKEKFEELVKQSHDILNTMYDNINKYHSGLGYDNIYDLKIEDMVFILEFTLKTTFDIYRDFYENSNKLKDYDGGIAEILLEAFKPLRQSLKHTQKISNFFKNYEKTKN